MNGANRYLKQRGQTWHYSRSVPKDLENLDRRYPKVRTSLKTKDIYEARQERDKLAGADDILWKALRDGLSASDAQAKYDAAIAINKALGFRRPEAGNLDFYDILARSAATDTLVPSQGTETVTVNDYPMYDPATGETYDGRVTGEVEIRDPLVMDALTGRVHKPDDRLSDLFDIYVNDLAYDDWQRKSPNQIKDWKKWPRNALKDLIKIVGDKAITKLDRQDALEFKSHLKHTLRTPSKKTGKPPSASSANRKLGILRVMFRKYYEEKLDDPDRDNPFAGMNFQETPRSRKPIKKEDLQRLLSEPSALAGLNEQARAIFLILVETGARLSEVANLRAEHIIWTTSILTSK